MKINLDDARRVRRFALALVAACVVFLLLLLVIAAPARAAPLCAPLASVLAHQKTAYGEEPIFIGATATRTIVVTRSPKGDWTVIQVEPDGETACVVVGGTTSDLTIGKPI